MNTPEAIGARLRTQDNRCTDEPIFYVECRRRIYGMDTQWAGDTVWIDQGNDCQEVHAPADGEETDEIIETGYVDIWERVMCAFTEDGCKEHLRLNGHNYRHFKEVRIYTDSLRRCPEMIAIRAMLMKGAQ